MSRILSADSAAGTSLHTSTTETVLKSYTIPADSFQVDKVYRFYATARVIDLSSGTLTVRARLGGTTLTGDVIGLSLVVTPAADGEMFAIAGWIHVTAIGTAGTCA